MDFAISYKIKTTCFLIFALVVTTSAQNNTVCPFVYLYHFGGGVFDNGNAIARPLGDQLPAARRPYGITFPGRPTGRWSDGRLDIDYGAQGLGFPTITAYLSPNSSSANAIMFAVARSPVLNRTFFVERDIITPLYAVSLREQLNWFRDYLTSSSSNATDRLNRIVNALFLFGDVEANDITYALLQGKSIREVTGYITSITQAQMNAAREVIGMGATRVIIPGCAPMGCYPFILTGFGSINRGDYDDIGCLRTVNDLIVLKNNDLLQAIESLRREFPNIFITYADFYNTELSLIREAFVANGSLALQACCGTGGRYNYNSTRFCGTLGVPVCADPNRYFFWDGIHLTQQANNRISTILGEDVHTALNCTTSIAQLKYHNLNLY